MKPKMILLVLCGSLLILNAAFAAKDLSDQFADIMVKYKQGAYSQVIKELDPFSKHKKFKPIVHYWKAICYNRLQEFDRAIPQFQQALRLKAKAPDLYYEYGQALYASISYRKARKAFLKSAQQNYKKGTSLYYIGFISQALEQYPTAIKYYQQVSTLDAEDGVKQAANFQMAEVMLLQAEKSPKPINKVKEIVLPQFEKALDVDASSVSASDIRRRIAEIKKKYELGPERWVNGKIIPKKRYRIYLRQRFAYDDNVIQESDQATTRATNRDSAISTTTGFARYTHIERNRIGLSPEIKLAKTHHFRRDQTDAAIYENDSYSISPALRTAFHHKLWKKAANMIFDIEYNYTARDRLRAKELIFFGRSVSYVLGENFRFFSVGDTAIRFKYKNFTSFQETSNSITKSLLMTQNIILPNKDFMIINSNIDYADVVNDLNSTNTYTFILNYIMSNFWKVKGLSLNLGATLTLLDTKRQDATRGLEKTYSPSIKFDYSLSRKIQLSLDYSYTKKTSKNKSVNAYTQNVGGLEVEYNF